MREIRSRTSRMNAIMNEQVSGMSLIQAYGRQHAAQRDFDETNVAYRNATNEIRDRVFAAIHQGATQEWSS